MTASKKTKITLAAPIAIAFDKLVLSQANVRRIAQGQTIEDLADDIAHRGLLQSLCVRPVLDEAGEETGTYEVPAGGRRFRALAHLVKTKRMAKTMSVPCIVREAGASIGAEEDSLAENTMREQLHPLDQFRAFLRLSEAGMSEADIAARFFVTETTVKQRLKLASVSDTLLTAYEAGEMQLEQLMAFTVSDDHALQERVWESFAKRGSGYHPNAYSIRQALTQDAVPAHDPRAVFVGFDAYEAAGGAIQRDLFSQRGEGWFQDAALLDRLAEEKLGEAAEPVIAEGWKWVEIALNHPYGATTGLIHLPTENRLSEEERAALAQVIEEYDALNEEYEDTSDDLPDDVDARLRVLEDRIAELEVGTTVYNPDHIAFGGAFVSLDYDGSVKIARGYARRADLPASEPDEMDGSDVAGEPGSASPENPGRSWTAVIDIGGALAATPAPEPEEEGDRPITEQHRIELTTYRTLALRQAVADDPEAAFIAVLHAMVIRVIVNSYKASSCLEVVTRSSLPDQSVKELDAFAPAMALDARRDAWAKRLPADHGEIWGYLIDLDVEARTDLFALCAGLSVNAMHEPYNRRPDTTVRANDLAALVRLDMSQSWEATAANYFNRVTKTRILRTVREAVGESKAVLLEPLKKAQMAQEAERMLAGSGWLPELLRTPGLYDGSEVPAGAEPPLTPIEPAEGSEALPAFLSEATETEEAADEEDPGASDYGVAAE
ncbi:MAG: ParB/RepB/Spo0J family partition protein [Methylorubrum rhodinum]|uniref:ParB/RepB/Spo0J family partition protein n=1 Tax=Methylorubrum rhodinum TaxID=29428 RepID=UPI003BB17FAA